jgi:restriction system protein
MARIDTMTGLDFEKYVAKLLETQGYSYIGLTEKYDLGVDIIAYKDGSRWGIQVKRYSYMVKAEAVRQVVTALKSYQCDRSMVITNSTYSKVARRLADSNGCVLVERGKLLSWIQHS